MSQTKKLNKNKRNKNATHTDIRTNAEKRSKQDIFRLNEEVEKETAYTLCKSSRKTNNPICEQSTIQCQRKESSLSNYNNSYLPINKEHKENEKSITESGDYACNLSAEEFQELIKNGSSDRKKNESSAKPNSIGNFEEFGSGETNGGNKLKLIQQIKDISNTGCASKDDLNIPNYSRPTAIGKQDEPCVLGITDGRTHARKSGKEPSEFINESLEDSRTSYPKYVLNQIILESTESGKKKNVVTLYLKYLILSKSKRLSEPCPDKPFVKTHVVVFVVTRAMFEDAVRIMTFSMLDLVDTKLFDENTRMLLYLPVYRDGYIHRKDHNRRWS